MKNQYFGDQTDYIKYGVLRHLEKIGFPLGVHWALTPDDGTSDGSRVGYLTKHREWRHYDPVVYDGIVEALANGRRDLRVVEDLQFVPSAIFCSDRWSTDPENRMWSIDQLLSALSGSSLVFIDPDNGIEVTSIKSRSKNSYKYIFMEEIEYVWNRNHSILIYQHFPRVERDTYVRRQLERVSAAVGGASTTAILTSHVAFLFCFQNHHAEMGERAVREISKHWTPATRMFGEKLNPDMVIDTQESESQEQQLDLPA